MKRLEYTPRIISLINRLREEIGSLNQARLFDINTHSENFVKDLFNLVYSQYKLVNINIVGSATNYPAIDLGDETSKIAIQVTSNANTSKVKNTISVFMKKELYKKYNRLIIFSITKKKAISDEFSTNGAFSFNPDRDLQDFGDLINQIVSYGAGKQKEILDFLEKEIEGTSSTNEPTRSNEVETIMQLIEYLSSDKNLSDIREPHIPDPHGKIYKRFSDYAGFLEAQIKDYIPRYESTRISAEEFLGLDSAKVTWIRTALQDMSDKLLREKHNDPKVALDSLVDFFENNLSSGGHTYDHGAIRYYLLHELIECNVFPDTAGK